METTDSDWQEEKGEGGGGEARKEGMETEEEGLKEGKEWREEKEEGGLE